ncbi:MAG: hypothetical protein FWG25_02345, partial [Promicromonosporaceae bacterium]|nr:hypothetical protein [Promicromonosporaceae bacterium]
MAKELAKALEEVHPDLVISTMSKASRKGKVMVDWSQNNAKKTTITPYSLRGIAYPNAVAPRTWDEIASPDLRQLSYGEVLERAHKYGDLISGLLPPTMTMTKEAAKSKGPLQADTATHRTETTPPSEGPGTGASRGAARHFEPMLASMPTKAELARLAQDGISDHPEWDFEMKWDGFRALASVTTDATGVKRVKLASRGGKDFTERFPELQAIAGQIVGPLPVVLDGEIVALRDNQPSFRDLQSHAIPVTYEAFDILQVGDDILLSEPLTTRRDLLEETLIPTPPIVDISPELPYLDAMTIADRYQLEGVMAKRAASPYQPGVRSKDWEKIKRVQEGTFVVVGWKAANQAGTPNEKAVGSLVLARQVSKTGLRAVGSVGTGFKVADRRQIAEELQQLTLESQPEILTGVTRAEAKGVHWVQPKRRAHIEFAEWTTADPEDPEARLRQPRWRGWV